ncbi:MAG: hypothetical protein QW514_09895 [Thermoprotei archaeon]
MKESGTRLFIIEITWDDCDAPDLHADLSAAKEGDFDYKLLEKGLRLSSPHLETILTISKAIVTRLEKAGCKPLFRLSTKLPQDITVVKSNTQSGLSWTKATGKKAKK